MTEEQKVRYVDVYQSHISNKHYKNDFIEFIGMSVLWNREIEIVLVGKWWMRFLMDMDIESGVRLDSMIFELINVYKGSEEEIATLLITFCFF